MFIKDEELGTLFEYPENNFEEFQTLSGVGEDIASEGETPVDAAAPAGARQWRCPQCGAILVFGYTQASAECPYCNNRLVALEKLSETQEPAGIIPFEITRSAADLAVKNAWPRDEFTSRDFDPQVEVAASVYIPYYLYSCDYEVQFIAGSSDAGIFMHDGSSRFEHVPVDASRGMPDSVANAMTPIDMSKVKPFDYRYLFGHAAELPDEDHAVCEARLLGALQRTFVGSQREETRILHEELSNGVAKYVLIPAYVYNVRWDGENHLVAVNGVTGQVAAPGKLFSKWKIMMRLLNIFVRSLIPAVIVGVGVGIFNFNLGVCFGLIVQFVLYYIRRSKLESELKDSSIWAGHNVREEANELAFGRNDSDRYERYELYGREDREKASEEAREEARADYFDILEADRQFDLYKGI